MVTLDGRADPVTVQVSAEMGTLELALATREPDPEERRQVVLLAGDQLLPLQLLAEWAAGHGEALSPDTLRLPAMAPGEYRLCAYGRAAVLEDAATGGTWRQHLGSCDGGYLSAGGTLKLAVPGG